MLEDGDTGGGEEDNDRFDTENLTATAASQDKVLQFTCRIYDAELHGITHF